MKQNPTNIIKKINDFLIYQTNYKHILYNNEKNVETHKVKKWQMTDNIF